MYLGEVHEVLEACVQMRLLPKTANTPEVGMVNVCIHPKEPLEHGAHHICEVWWEGNTILLWENSGVIHLHLAQPVECFAYAQIPLQPKRVPSAIYCEK